MNWFEARGEALKRNVLLVIINKLECLFQGFHSKKINYGILVCVSLFSQCKSAQTPIVFKTLKFQYTEDYCGGAVPSEALLQQMQSIKPMANREIEIFAGNPMYVNPIIYKTNALGEIQVPTTLGQSIYVNIYPSINGFKNDSEEFECYKKFVSQHYIRVDLGVPDKILNFSTILHCNPCIPLAP